MVYGVIIILSIILLGWFLLICPITVEISYSREENQDKGELHIRYLLGLIHIHRFLQELQTKTTEEGPAIQIHSNNQERTKKHSLTLKEFVENFRPWMDFIKESTPLFKSLLSHVFIKQSIFKANIGTGDAVTTGLSTGAVWSIISPLLGYLSTHSHFEQNPDIQIQPNFQQKLLQIHLYGIMKIRAGYAIKAGIRVLLAWKRRTT